MSAKTLADRNKLNSQTADAGEIDLESKKIEAKGLGTRAQELEDSRRALMNILEDVEEARQKAEEEKNKTQAIITNFADGLLMFDEEKNLVLINPQAGKFFGAEGKSLVGQSIKQLGASVDFKELVDLIGKEIKIIFRKELKLRSDLILEASTISVVRGEEMLGILVILHDITREKNIEKLKTEFVSLAAHQLRTPLSAIKWTLKMLLSGDLGEITAEQRDFIEKSYNSNERMIHLINDLLNVTRLEEGRYIYRLSEFKPEEAFSSVLASLKEKIDAKQINLSYHLPPKKLPTIVADREKIEIAMQNLLDNAINYSSNGDSVEVFIDGGQNGWTFKVSDSGIGIDENQKKRLFEKFYRGENAVKKDTQGTGLGLFLTKNIVESHGGQISFSSILGSGSVFSFSLPFRAKIKEAKVSGSDGR